MPQPLEINHPKKLQLTPERAVFDPESNALFVADTHFGKSGTFRQGGIPVPGNLSNPDYDRLDALLSCFNPAKLFFLGDLFHSRLNSEWHAFETWRKKHAGTEMILISGNHDILNESLYLENKLEVREEGYNFGGMILRHYPPENSSNNQNLTLCGHLHPGVKLSGSGRESLVLPCFHLRKNVLTLPAFGSFTGLHKIKAEPGDDFYVVYEETVKHFGVSQ